MTAEMLISQFQFNQMVLTRLLSDISHDESLKPTAEDGKCINCLLGHILAARSDLLTQMQCPSHWNENDAAPYRIKENRFEASRAHKLDGLKTVLDDSYSRLIAAVEESRATLDEMSPLPTATGRKLTWGQRAGSYICHEAYHAGQIGLMRRLIGKPGLF
jgi:uncharacterized damage-inducible protein DinB